MFGNERNRYFSNSMSQKKFKKLRSLSKLFASLQPQDMANRKDADTIYKELKKMNNGNFGKTFSQSG